MDCLGFHKRQFSQKTSLLDAAAAFLQQNAPVGPPERFGFTGGLWIKKLKEAHSKDQGSAAADDFASSLKGETPSLRLPRPFRIPNKRLNTQSPSIGWIFTNRYFFRVHSCPCLLETFQRMKHPPPDRLSRAYLHFLQYSTTSHSIMYKHPFKLYKRSKC